jgi:hypothetical protein
MFDTDDFVLLLLAQNGADFKDDTAGAVTGFSATTAISCILARRMLLLVDAEEWAAIFFRVDDAVTYLERFELVIFVTEPAFFKP